MRLTGTGVWSHHLRYGDAGADRRSGGGARRARATARSGSPTSAATCSARSRLLLRRDAAHHRRDRHPQHLDARTRRSRATARVVERDWQRRFLLGLGVSHAPLIDHGNPGRYTKPFSKMVEYLDGLDAAAVPCPVDARVLAALRPRMLGLAARSRRGRAPLLRAARARRAGARDPRARRDDRGRARRRARHRSRRRHARPRAGTRRST